MIKEACMEIIVKGRNEIISKEEMKYVANFFGEILLGKRLARNIYLEIYNTDFGNFKEAGYCHYTDLDSRKPRDFWIEINNKMRYHEQVETLAHEMVHLKQFARGEWKQHEKYGQYTWMGRRMFIPDHLYDKKYEKKQLPWEKEAYLSEPWLAGFYREHCENNELVW